MTKPVSVDFQFTVQQRGRGAKKQIVEGTGKARDSNSTLERIPRISRYMALAIHFEELISQGVVTDYADVARLGHVSRARVTQIMNLRLLSPAIQEELLYLERSACFGELIQLKRIQAISKEANWVFQMSLWKKMNSRSH